ncbi:MAG TPA: CorA family divalent cation transporter, partial [Thermoanaerobaculia bacterium]
MRYHPPGTAPGTLRAPDPSATAAVRVTVIDYGPDHLDEREIKSVEELADYRDTPTVTWINVEGLNDVPFLEGLGRLFEFHPLALEDVLNCGQRPKLEDYGKYHFLVMKSLRLGQGEEKDELEVE